MLKLDFERTGNQTYDESPSIIIVCEFTLYGPVCPYLLIDDIIFPLF